MASKRDLKKDINFVIGEVIESIYFWQSSNPTKDMNESEAIIDDAIDTFNDLIKKVNDKGYTDSKAHFKSITDELKLSEKQLIEQIKGLS